MRQRQHSERLAFGSALALADIRHHLLRCAKVKKLPFARRARILDKIARNRMKCAMTTQGNR